MNVLNFNQKQCSEVSLSGGKGASLARLTQMGMKVPQGYVITVEAFETFLKENNLETYIKKEIQKLDIKSFGELVKKSQRICDLIEDGKISQKLSDDIVNNWDLLDLQKVAVRSSATSEDSVDNSWAGELETYLNISKSSLKKYIKKCWSSLFSPRALTYMVERNLKNTNISVAVIVQTMLDSQIAGNCFTVHPVSHQRDLMVIEAVFGQGEGLVSGEITPDKYIVSSKYEAVLKVKSTEQLKKISLHSKKSGEIWEKVNRSEIKRQKLSYRDILTLAKQCVEVAKGYGIPQDIEWSYIDGTFYILQSRPITTL